VFLLDTNVISELRKQRRADARVASWFQTHDCELMFISVIVVAEIETGVRMIERRDKRQGRLLRVWAEAVYAEFCDRLIPVDGSIARLFAGLQVPDRRPERDAWIAATALSSSLVVVTRNDADFRAMGVKLVNPWK
jgi:toxin FitB